jgi:hypothetical protein
MVVAIDSTYGAPHSTPDYNIALSDRQAVTLILLDSSKVHLRTLLNLELDSGTYSIYLDKSTWAESLSNTYPVFYILEIIGETYRYRRSIYLK